MELHRLTITFLSVFQEEDTMPEVKGNGDDDDDDRRLYTFQSAKEEK